MDRVGEHFVPAGPLAVRWLAYELVPTSAFPWFRGTLYSTRYTATIAIATAGEHTFFAKVTDKQIAFNLGPNGRAQRFVLYQPGRQPMAGVRVS